MTIDAIFMLLACSLGTAAVAPEEDPGEVPTCEGCGDNSPPSIPPPAVHFSETFQDPADPDGTITLSTDVVFGLTITPDSGECWMPLFPDDLRCVMAFPCTPFVDVSATRLDRWERYYLGAFEEGGLGSPGDDGVANYNIIVRPTGIVCGTPVPTTIDYNGIAIVELPNISAFTFSLFSDYIGINCGVTCKFSFAVGFIVSDIDPPNALLHVGLPSFTGRLKCSPCAENG